MGRPRLRAEETYDADKSAFNKKAFDFPGVKLF